MTEAEMRTLQQEKYYSNHKQYKVYLTCDVDEEIIKMLDAHSKKSAFIRKALIHEKERRYGRWVERRDNYGHLYAYKCSECDSGIFFEGMSRNFCPNCGADMRGDKK